MKRILVLTLLLSGIVFRPPSADADTVAAFRIDFETLMTDHDRFQPGVAVLATVADKDGALGGFVFSWVGEDYAESYGGFTLAFPVRRGGRLWTAWGIGIEQSAETDDHSPLRLGAMARLDFPRHLLFARLEIGTTQKKFTEPLYDARYAYRPHAHFDFGIMGRDGAGIGPRIDFWLHKPGLGVWAAPLYDPETDSWRGMLTFTAGY